MKLFTVRLSDDERAKLEAHRVRLGFRSESDVIRHWIEEAPSASAVPAPQKQAYLDARLWALLDAPQRGGRMSAEVHIAEIDTEALTVTLTDGRVWPITHLVGSEDPDEAEAFVAGEGSEWITERFSDFVDRIK